MLKRLQEGHSTALTGELISVLANSPRELTGLRGSDARWIAFEEQLNEKVLQNSDSTGRAIFEV
jgi:hypothetical protein